VPQTLGEKWKHLPAHSKPSADLRSVLTVDVEGAPQPFRVMIIDDDPSIVRLVAALVVREGLEVIRCASGAEGMAAIESEAWDLLLLDLQLGDMDGADICRRIKADARFNTRQVIMLTGRSSSHDKVAGFARGADDYITKPFQHEELLARVRAAKRVIDLQNELLAVTRRLEAISVTDSLTGVYNRRHMGATLQQAFDRAIRYQRPLSLTIVDVDFFKRINDSMGHQSGDEVLAEVARRFAASIRSSDYVARYGGEEFLIILPETRLEEALTFAEKLRGAIASRPVVTSAGEIQVTVSVGTASLPHTEFESPEAMLSAADRALYRAKNNGRNRVEAERRRHSRQECSPEGTRSRRDSAGA
jgi:two-component system cell cycle response regulator